MSEYGSEGTTGTVTTDSSEQHKEGGLQVGAARTTSRVPRSGACPWAI